MKRSTAIVYLALFLLPQGSVSGETAVSPTLGFNKVVCLPNSDTIVGVPFRQQGSRMGALASAPDISGDSATLTLSGNPSLPNGGLDKHYVKFSSGAKDGRYYDITGNTADTLTLDLNGDSLAGVVEGDKVVIAEYWTLDTLFPPDKATTSWTEIPPGSGNWVPDGHAVVASLGTLPTGRRTEIRVVDPTTAGTNLPVSGRYFVNAGVWRKSGDAVTDFGGLILYPDQCFRISHPATVLRETVFGASGDVETGNFSVPLSTRSEGLQDNLVSIPRPVAVTLDELNLRQSGAFVPSLGTLPGDRRDLLLVFDNEAQLINKAPSATYFVVGGQWRKVGSGTSNVGGDQLPPGVGFIVRKYQTTSGETVFWNNLPSY